jgi:hypothetical protein
MNLQNLTYTKIEEYDVKDIYSFPLEIPEGYEATGEFRPVEKNEFFLSSITSNALIYPGMDDAISSDPRIILRKKLSFAEQWEFDEGVQPRVPMKGEYYISELIDNRPVIYHLTTNYYVAGGTRFIVKRKDTK